MSLASASKREIQLLGKSPAFAMSLGAKELFHTNFLAFLLESDEPSLEPIQLAIRRALNFSPSEGALSRCAVWREKNNLDLIVVELRSMHAEQTEQQFDSKNSSSAVTCDEEEIRSWDWSPYDKWRESGNIAAEPNPVNAESTGCDVPVGRVMLIEAKLKSVPRLEQLTDYDKRLAKSGIKLAYPEDAAKPDWRLPANRKTKILIERRLLSVTGISMTTSANWIGVSWKNLYEAMNPQVDTLIGTPMQRTLTDYIEVLGALVNLLDRVHQACIDAHIEINNGPTYGSLRKQVLDPQFKSLRIHDLLGKTLFDYWLTSYCIPDIKKIRCPEGWSLNTYVNYSRGVPGMGVEFVNSAFRMPNNNIVTLRVGVQIQNCEFRLFVDVTAGWSGLEEWIAKSSLLMDGWFGVTVFGSTPVGTRGLPIISPIERGRATNLKVFGVNRFLYSKVDIDNQPVANVEQELARTIAVASSVLCKLNPADSLGIAH